MPRKLMAAKASPVEIADAPPRESARLSCCCSVMWWLLSLAEEDEHGHRVQTHHVVGSALGLDGALHVVGHRVGITPEDLGEIHAVTAHDQVRDPVEATDHRLRGAVVDDVGEPHVVDIDRLDVHPARPAGQGLLRPRAGVGLLDVLLERLLQLVCADGLAVLGAHRPTPVAIFAPAWTSSRSASSPRTAAAASSPERMAPSI